MNRHSKIWRAAILFISFGLLASCQENEPVGLSETEEIQLAESATFANNTVDEDLQHLEELTSEESISGGRTNNQRCAQTTRDAQAKTVTIDFGDGCIGPHGRLRTGKVIVTYGGAFDDNLANRVIKFENYRVNNRLITGSIELRDFNLNSSNNLTATLRFINYTATGPNGRTVIVNGSTTREWIAGAGDGDRTNDVFSITGSYEVKAPRVTVTHTITEPVIVSFPCRTEGGFLRTAGVVEMTVRTPRVTRTRTIRYGDGTCDNSFTIIINGKEHKVTSED